jgi:chaperonin GroES
MNYLNLDTKLTTTGIASQKNLCGRFTDKDLDTIGSLIWDAYERDKQSRFHWEQRMEAGMDLALQMSKPKNYPWPGAANVVFPLVTIAAMQFSARSYENIIQGTDVVRYRTIGQSKDGEIAKRAERISRHMSWQVLEQDTAWEEQHDRMLINLGIVGTTIIKSYHCPRRQYNVSELVMAKDFVIDYWATSIEAAARKTQCVPLYRNEIYERVRAGTFRDILAESWYTSITVPETTRPTNERRGSEPPPPDHDTPLMCLEQHCSMDFDQDGYAEPYIITIDQKSKCVLRIVARWEQESDIKYNDRNQVLSIKATEYFTKFGFIPSPDGGFYDIGFGILLGPLNETVNSGINQLIDAGTMANSNGGFLGRGAKIRGGVYTFAPWEWKRIDSTGDDIKKSMVPFPVREPSNVMLSLLSLIIDYTDRVAGTVEQAVGKNPGQNTPAETSRNTLEQGMRVYASIFKRVWRSLKEEFKKLHQLNARYLAIKEEFGDKGEEIRREDYSSNPDQVVPVADPNITSRQMRISQWGIVREAAAQMPGYDRPLVEKKFLAAMQVDDIDNIYPGPDKVPPLPNPKLQVEEAKLKGIQMRIDGEKQRLMGTILSQQKEVQAKINLLQAQAVEIMAGVQTEQAKLKLASFEAIVEALETHNSMMNNTLQTLSGVQSEQNEAAKPGGVGDAGDKPSASSPQGSPSPSPGGT